jgi:small subunit ribosomal protein S6e
MRITIAFPEKGTQICIDIEEQHILNALNGRRLGEKLDGEILGGQFKGYTFRIGGGFDKQGFPMKMGVLSPRRVKLLLKQGNSCYHCHKDGERKRKSVRGSIIAGDISALHLIVDEPGEGQIKGLTDNEIPSRYGPKRATKLRRMFVDGEKCDDVQKLVLKRTVKENRFTRPKVQRLITPKRINRKKKELLERKARKERAESRARAYEQLRQSLRK